RGRKKATAETNGAAPVEAKIHVPAADLGQTPGAEEPVAEEPVAEEPVAEEPVAESSVDGDGTEPPKPKKKTRRGTRGGRNRKKKTGAAAVARAEADPAGEEANSEGEYVPMAEWGDD